MQGFIALHRKMLGWEWFEDRRVLQLFIFLLLKANYKTKSWQGIKILRGQYLTSLASISEQTGMSVQMIRTALAKLEKTGEVTNTSTKLHRIITVCKYDEYQTDTKEEQQRYQQTSNKAATTTNKDNKDNKEKIKTYRPDFVSEQDWKDLLDHRKKHPKKPTNSDRALMILAGKIKKTMTAGYSATDIVETIISRNWQTIEPHWMNNTKEKSNGTGQKRNTSGQQDKRSDILSKAARHVLAQRVNEAGDS